MIVRLSVKVGDVDRLFLLIRRLARAALPVLFLSRPPFLVERLSLVSFVKHLHFVLRATRLRCVRAVQNGSPPLRYLILSKSLLHCSLFSLILLVGGIAR